MEEVEVIERHVKFIKKPRIGDIVKVYMKSKINRFGIVTGTFTKEHNFNYPPTHSLIETVILDHCEEVPIEEVNFFLDENRVEFTDKKLK